jgi:predicted ATPase
MPELPTGTVTFLFTDIEGSTRLLDELRDRYAGVLAEHHRLIREAITEHGGVEVDTQGDAFFVAFTRASDAVAAAADAQAALASGQVRVRMGLHTGEPGTTEEGYVGLDVHRAARIGNAANGGQVVLSPTTRELLGDDADLLDLGEHRLKDFPAATRLYQLGTAVFPPLRTPDEARLPSAPTPLIGRKKELGEAVRLLREDGVRLLTVTGPGGVGKTRFAVEAATDLLDSFTDGARFADLAPLRSPDVVLSAIGQAVRARGSVEEALRDQHVLLVLDNAEHVAAAAPELATLLEDCQGVSVLVTSREPLHLSLEHELPLRPIPEAPAVELFRQRARLADPDFEGDYSVLADTCTRLDGLPLAIELAAARIKVLGAKRLLERLEHRLPLLTGRGRDVPERQRTLRATIEWSYGLLDEEQQRVFAALGAFVGGFTVEAAEEVAEADLNTIESLVDKSLIRAEEGRLSMLETIREFTLERADETGLAQVVRSRHADYFLTVAEEQRTYGRALAWTEASDVEWYELEHDNLRAALDWLNHRREFEKELRLAVACHDFWAHAGHWSEGRRRIEEALEHATTASPLLTARANWSAGEFAWRQGDFERGRVLAERALALHREVGTGGSELAWALAQLGICELNLGNIDRAVRLYENAAGLARHLGDEVTLAVIANNLGHVALVEHDLPRAKRCFEEALPVFRRSARPSGLANTLVDIGFVALAEKRLVDASAALRESLALSRAEKLPELLLWALEGLAAVAVERGAQTSAVRLLATTTRLREELTQGAYYPIGDEIRERTIAAAKAHLDDATFAEAWTEGSGASREAAAEQAALIN